MEILADMWSLLTPEEQMGWDKLLEVVTFQFALYSLISWADIPPQDWATHQDSQINNVVMEVREALNTLERSSPAIRNKRKGFTRFGQGTRLRMANRLLLAEQSASEVWINITGGFEFTDLGSLQLN